MSHLIPNLTSSYFLTDEEVEEGSKLTITQTQVIQNQIATLTQEKLLLTPDNTNIQNYVQEEAYLRGQIDSLSYLLTTSESLSDESINLNLAEASVATINP